MKSFFVILTMICALFGSAPAWSGMFSSCASASKEPMPDWVSQTDYSLPGYYVGVGSAETDGQGEHQQNMDAESDAKARLIEQIEVKIQAENEMTTRVSNQKAQKDALSKVTVSAEEVLRGLSIRSRWVEKTTCTHYTLMVISKESITQAKQEKIMKSRLAQVKFQLVEGIDRDKNRDISVRRKHLDDAQSLLTDTNFTFLPEELGKEVYAKQISEALDQLNKETSQTQGRMALFALNRSDTLQESVIGKMLDQLRSGDNTTDRLMADCKYEEDCISRAKERGFTMITILGANTQIVTSQMGTLRGTLTLSKTVFDIQSRKIVKGPDTAYAEVIGWSKSELDWDNAAEKAMQSFK